MTSKSEHIQAAIRRSVQDRSDGNHRHYDSLMQHTLLEHVAALTQRLLELEAKVDQALGGCDGSTDVP